MQFFYNLKDFCDMTHYNQFPLKNFATVQSGFAFSTNSWKKIGIPVVKIANLKNKRIDLSSCSFIDEETANSVPKFQIFEDDILISLTGYVGEVGLVKKNNLPAFFNQRVGKFSIFKENLLNRKFLYYFLTNEETRQKIEKASTGSAQLNISPSSILELQIPLPEIFTQNLIVDFLDNLENKIDLNRNLNETLETMAQAIFKDWFIDFGPTRAKMEGRAPYLAQEIWDLFPESLDEEGKPQGWSHKKLEDEFSILMGQSPPGESYNSNKEGILFFQGRTDFKFRYPQPRIFCTAPTRIAQKDDTLVSVRAPVGDINMAQQPCAIGRGIASVRHKKNFTSYTYYTMKSLDHAFKSFDKEGTIFGSINKQQFSDLQHVFAGDDTIKAFENLVSPFDQKIFCNSQETENLKNIRDLLLPKLMSGELRIKDAEQLVEKSV